MVTKRWWQISTIISVVLIMILISLWIKMNDYTTNPMQLTNEQHVSDALIHWESDSYSQKVPMIEIKTGIFIQSLQFLNSTDVNVSGYIWQHYPKDKKNILPKPGEPGFILPDQVNSGGDLSSREVYREFVNDEYVIGWYFESTLRQRFDYSRYPFDHQTVWVRLWPDDFTINIVQVPDFESYKATGLNDVFGIEKNILLGTWERENTYFDYITPTYDTNFGLDIFTELKEHPELRYNFVIKRKFENAFIIYLLPWLLVAALLFAALLTVSRKDDLSERLGFNTSGFIGACSGLFFVVLLAHIQLREKFAAEGVVYIEYFYILMYVMLVFATANTYLFSVNSKFFGRVIMYEDNLIPKVVYWPFVISCVIGITVFVM